MSKENDLTVAAYPTPVVLVVDDTPANLGVICDYLTDYEFEIIAARSGEECLEIVAATAPDLILLDVMMPGLDGFAVCRRLKSDATTRDIPVIFMTALANTEDKVKGFAAGAVDYVTKPVQQEEVLARVRTHLTLRQQQIQLQTLNSTLSQFNQALEAKVRERTAELELLDRSKADFISTMGQELRGPVETLLSHNTLLHNHFAVRSDRQLSRIVDDVHINLQQLQEITTVLLDVAALEQGTLQLTYQEVAVEPLLIQIQQAFQWALTKRRLTLDLHPDLAALPPLMADAAQLRKALTNIVENAIKYTPDWEKITIHGVAHAPGACLAGAAVELIVSDKGIGIDPQYHTLIFTKFFHTGASAFSITNKTRFKGGGAGLGLTVAQGIVNAHGGRLWVESAGYSESQLPGSQFHIVLPVRPS